MFFAHERPKNSRGNFILTLKCSRPRNIYFSAKIRTLFYTRRAFDISRTNQMYLPVGRELQEWMSKTNLQEFSSNSFIFSLLYKKERKYILTKYWRIISLRNRVAGDSNLSNTFLIVYQTTRPLLQQERFLY